MRGAASSLRWLLEFDQQATSAMKPSGKAVLTARMQVEAYLAEAHIISNVVDPDSRSATLSRKASAGPSALCRTVGEEAAVDLMRILHHQERRGHAFANIGERVLHIDWIAGSLSVPDLLLRGGGLHQDIPA